MQDTNVPMRLKRKAFNEYILPVMTFDCKTLSHSTTQLEKLVTAQRKMEEIMVGVALKDRKSTIVYNCVFNTSSLFYYQYEIAESCNV